MRQLVLGGMLWLLAATSSWADGERAGEFDYYILSLSWSPNWCATTGDSRGSEQCDPSRDLGWVVHGLWPQYERGWPSYCKTAVRAPTRSMTAAQADLFGTSGAAWYQWKKHGSCAGLEAGVYYDLIRDAFGKVNRPEVFRKLEDPVRLPASVVEEAFLQANPEWEPDMLTITCKGDRIQEARLCLTKDLEPRICARDVRRDCSATKALLDPVR
ncbi:ribonuclease T2 [Aliiroseovarius sp. F20344]|uniref:ribonuclease T2 n=1 Tax=Aliiroseovarius sp. F20344 TaxID=2926414 RepID=UPI001FF5A058|nr:ribonuclease T2 [Aliiroseovarius sp. F20344]MCK0141009.1 ribonuclease T2 [Aliiroseovarius sp. F20344]